MNIAVCMNKCLIHYEPVSGMSIWWDCHATLFVYGRDLELLREAQCSAMTIPQAKRVAESLAKECIPEPPNLFRMIEWANEMDRLDLTDLKL